MTKNTDEKHSYGALSIVILTITIVVGSGLFFKNDEVFASNNSAILTIVSWILASGLILTIVYAFMEISSTTALKGEIGSVSTWTDKFYNKKLARLVGYFFIFFNLPINVVLLSTYSADLFFGMLQDNNLFANLSTNGIFWLRTTMTTMFALGILALIGALNFNSNKQSKISQQVGMIFKIAPIILVIGVAFAALVSIGFQDNITNVGGVFDPSSIKNTGLNDASGGQILTLIIISLPPIMFAFDGFIYSANLQSETKSPRSFFWGILIGISIIAFTYLFVSMGLFYLGDGTNFSLFGVIANAFPNAKWLANLFNIILILSIISGVNGLFMACMRQTASMSTDNLVKDENFKLLKRNKHKIPTNAGYLFLFVTFLWMIGLRGLDLLSGLDQTFWNSENYTSINYMALSIYAGNTIVLFSYIAYGLIIFGGVLNRKTKRIEVQKVKGFIPVAFIAIAGVLFIAIYSLIQIFMSPFNNLTAYFQILLLIWYVVGLTLVYLYNSKKLKHLDHEFIVKKQIEIERFYE